MDPLRSQMDTGRSLTPALRPPPGVAPHPSQGPRLPGSEVAPTQQQNPPGSLPTLLPSPFQKRLQGQFQDLRPPDH